MLRFLKFYFLLIIFSIVFIVLSFVNIKLVYVLQVDGSLIINVENVMGLIIINKNGELIL